MSLVLFELLLHNCESAFLLLLEVLTRGAKGRENSQEDNGSKTADMEIFLVLVFFFLILNILSTEELDTDKTSLLDARGCPKLEMLSNRPEVTI